MTFVKSLKQHLTLACLTLLAFLCGQSTAIAAPPNVVFFLADDLIRNWLRNRNTVEFLGIWERLNNPGFNPVEFDGIRMQAGLNSFTLTPKQWIERTGALGIVSKAGRYGGTYAHKDIPRRLIAVCTNLGVHRESNIARTKPGIPGLRPLVQEVMASGLFRAK
jgi:hypothetical protein